MDACQIHIDHFEISVKVSTHGVHILCDEVFVSLMKSIPVVGVQKLSIALRNLFADVQKRPLRINANSISMEIWGHYYFDQMFFFVDKFWPKRFATKIRNRLKQATLAIDIAEKGYDNNRWIWDMTAPAAFIVARIIAVSMRLRKM